MPDDIDPSLAGRPTVRRRLATMLAFAVAPAVIFSIVDGVSRFQRLTEERGEAFFNAAVVDAQATRDVFVGLRAVASTIALDPDVAGFREPACSEILQRAVAANPFYRLAVAVDVEGRVRCASRDVPDGMSFADDPAFAAFVARPGFDLAVTDVGRVSREEVVIGSAPLTRNGAFVGVLSISVAASSLRFLAHPGEEGAGRRPFRAILGADGAVLLGARTGDGTADWLPGVDVAPRLGASPVSFAAPGLDGAERFYSISPFVLGRAWLLAGSEKTALFDEVTLRVLPAIVTPLIMLIIAVGVAYVALDRLVVRHVVHLARLTRVYGRGRLDQRPKLEDNAPREIASLGASLGSMAESLAARQRELRASAETNRVLLLELFHRVRNNLQMIASLLNLQARGATSEVERAALERTRARIHSLALVHEKLYERDAPDRLDLSRLLGDVARAVLEPLGVETRPRLTLDLDPRIETPARATPLALFLNEAVADAVEHGASTDGAPDVAVTLRAAPDGGLALTVANDAAAPTAPRQPGPLGARLMDGFARQLRATLTHARDGARHVVTLAVPPEDKPPAP